MKILTLYIIHQHLKEGRWNGFGGKVNAGESIEEAVKRELFEEVGISAPK